MIVVVFVRRRSPLLLPELLVVVVAAVVATRLPSLRRRVRTLLARAQRNARAQEKSLYAKSQKKKEDK